MKLHSLSLSRIKRFSIVIRPLFKEQKNYRTANTSHLHRKILNIHHKSNQLVIRPHMESMAFLFGVAYCFGMCQHECLQTKASRHPHHHHRHRGQLSNNFHPARPHQKRTVQGDRNARKEFLSGNSRPGDLMTTGIVHPSFARVVRWWLFVRLRVKIDLLREIGKRKNLQANCNGHRSGVTCLIQSTRNVLPYILHLGDNRLQNGKLTRQMAVNWSSFEYN